ncbi:hypothetical protein C6500_00025 [Candidatus Poribacteria bacterium]|nr:MAG: hypothetical protein C6500_00025 [Candidatus Poribacteria bacterium]
MFTRVLIANRGEIAIRVARAAKALNIESLGIYAEVDKDSLHTRFTDKSVQLPRSNDPVASYLNSEDLIRVAKENECDCVHPGYGFLSENVQFAEMCADSGITFVGPLPSHLKLFGDKVQARRLASELGVPTIPGTDSYDTVDALLNHEKSIDYPVMIKAVAGGGGRGMGIARNESELKEEFERCSREAEAAFANGALFLEHYLENAKHIEVQVFGDVRGKVIHLYERECSLQLRNQKVIEFAPAPELDAGLRKLIHQDAVRLCEAKQYLNAGTVEFLVDVESGSHYFIECNPRIQVEHTVTEEITGQDLVQTQFKLADGQSLHDLGMGEQDDIPKPQGYSIQSRVVTKGSGTIHSYREPSGPGIRVDSNAYTGYEVPAAFDPLISKVVVSVRSGETFDSAVSKAQNAINEYQIDGVPNNLDDLARILAHEQVKQGRATTSLLTKDQELLNGSRPAPSAVLDLINRKQPLQGRGSSKTVITPKPKLQPTDDQVAVECPIESTVQHVHVSVDDQVTIGQALLTVNAMKMETRVQSPCTGTIVEMQSLAEGDVLGASQIVALVSPSSTSGEKTGLDVRQTWKPLLDQITRLKSLAFERLAPGSEDPGVVRQRSRGKLTCRERIELLLDEGSFHEIGSVTGFASYDEEGNVIDFTPANHMGGWGTIEKRTAIVCADDFTSRGGHADGAVGAKSGHLDRLSIEMRVPAIRLLDGSSGGGSVAAMVPKQKQEGESDAKESSGAIKAGRPRVAGGGGSYLPGHLGSAMFTQQLATVPVVNMLLGSVVGIGAAKAVLGHFSVMVRDISQLFVAGPPVVSHAMGYDITKEDLGDWRIHCTNGSVDNLAETEEDAISQVIRFLSYLPGNVFEAPPVHNTDLADPPDRREEELFTLVPRKRTTTFNIRRAIDLMVDRNSFFEIGGHWGTDQVTGFARFNGHPVGVIASDSQHENGGALTADGCKKLTRHLDLCDVFHLPIVNLVDNPGFAVGLEHETLGTIRAGGEWMVAFSQIEVPVFTVLMRRSFGVAGNNYATPRSSPSMRVAWPAADVGGIPPEGGIEAAYKRQLAETADPVALRAEIEARIESARGPLGPLSRFQIEEMIDPRDTRRYICEWVELAFRIVSQSDRLGSRALQFRP